MNILDDNYKFSSSGTYYAPNDGTFEDYQEYILQLPINDSTEIFGLHENAEITKSIIETNYVCDTILSLLPRKAGGSGDTNEADIIK